MATFSLVAIPFVVLSGIMFALASHQRKSVYVILGGVFLASALVNSILGLTTGI